MERSLTHLENGVLVRMNLEEWESYKKAHSKGLLESENYPDEWKKISLAGEVGRFLWFRFIVDK